jgi:DNA end-binding protein Ku
MARSIWTGTIAFGLVNINVKLFSAVTDGSIDFDMLDEKDKHRIRYKRVNERTEKEVKWSSIVKGYKLNDGYVILTPADFESAAAEKSRQINITSFVKESEIDTIFYETVYYLEPGKADQKPYALLRDAMTRTKMVGLGSFVMRNKEMLCVIKVYQNALVLCKIHFEAEIKPLSDYNIPAASYKLSAAEIKMAVSLIDAMKSDFDISAYKDEYTEHLMKLIKRKAKGKKYEAPKTIEKKLPGDVSSLLEQLKASLQGPPKKTKAAAPKKVAKKTIKKVGAKRKVSAE